MTTPKIESGSVATSTIAADPSLTRHTALTRRLLILAIAGAGVAWLYAPAGRMLVVQSGQATALGRIAHRLTLRPPETAFEHGTKSVRIAAGGQRSGIKQGRVFLESGRSYDGSVWIKIESGAPRLALHP